MGENAGGGGEGKQDAVVVGALPGVVVCAASCVTGVVCN